MIICTLICRISYKADILKKMYPCHRPKCLSTILLLLLFALHSFGAIHASQNDFDCLISIKASLEDPLGYLSTWSFDNITEGFICNFIGIECWQPYENKVLNIRLSEMELKGQFPRGIEKCSSLTGLDLSGNQLYGAIPSDVGKIIGEITWLDLSYNRFSGEIPVSLGNCAYLNVLKLDNNELTGQIPPQIVLLDRIKVFSVANNSLTGRVPTFRNAVIPAQCYANNEGLCGDPLEPCKPVASKDHSSRDFFINGFVTGWAVFVLLSIYIWLFGFPCAAISKILIAKKVKVYSTSICPEQEDIDNHYKILQLEKYVSRISFIEMENATSSFREDNVVGYGSLGKVYKASLPNGLILAIKRLHKTQNLDEEFASEIVTLGKLKHQNLVPLIGFCCKGEEKLLVYKYMPNHSLHDWLYATEDKAKALDWPMRMKIAVGVAKALSWLHYSCGLNVVHNGLCSKCILLDQNFEPKISKFWEATIMNPNGTASGCCLLSKAEYGDNFSPYTKDVYCFGIVLLQLITRKEAYELGCCNTISQFEIDGVLKHRGFDDSIAEFLEIGKSCVKFMPNQRPTMLQVYESLASIAQAWVTNNDSEISMDYT